MAEQDREDDSANFSSMLEDLVNRARNLLAEMHLFREHLRRIREELNVMVATFTSTVQSELAMLERLSERGHDESAVHIARSSNLIFLETVWGHVKASKGVVALRQKMYPDSPTQQRPQAMRHVQINHVGTGRGPKHGAVSVDGIVDSGRTWIKVSLVTNSRLLFDLAKQGWTGESSSEDERDEATDRLAGPESDDDLDVPLVKTAKELTRATRSFRVRTKIPQVRLVLPRVELGNIAQVDAIVEACRQTGATVLCGNDAQIASRPLEEIMHTMAPNPFDMFTETLNIDCTILLALVSEFSHARVSKEPWFHTSLKRQVEIEGNENLLPSLLYPALGRHRLVCTHEAARRMREIVSTIGTPSEKVRTAVMLGDEPEKSQMQLVEALQQWSAYPVPLDLQLPIRIINHQNVDQWSELPTEALEVSARMTDINKSVFVYGWAMGYTTITSNRVVSRQIESDLEKYEALDDSIWPRIWLCPTARSLVGKEKRGAEKSAKKAGVWPLPDPLRREEQRRNGLDVLTLREGHEVDDLRPNGYPCGEVLEAKNAAGAYQAVHDKLPIQ